MRLAGVGLLLLSGVALAGQPPRDPRTTLLPAGSAVIRGRVVAAGTGDALRHSRISTSSPQGRAPTVLSDEEGRFVLGSLPGGTFTISAAKAGYSKESAVVSLADDGTADVDLQLAKGGTILGSVFDEFGDPAVDVSVAVSLVEAGKARIVSISQSDDLGNYRIAGVGPGTYVVNASPPGTRREIDQFGRMSMMSTAELRGRDATIYYPGVSDLAAAQRIDIQGGDEKSGVSFVIPVAALPLPRSPQSIVNPSEEQRKASAVIRGRVVRGSGAPVPGARVAAIPFEAFPPRPAMVALTDADGLYTLTIPEAASARYRVLATKSAFAPGLFGDRLSAPRGEPIALRAGEARDHTDITMHGLAGLSGTIVDDLGEPVEGVSVQAVALRYQGGRRQLVPMGMPRKTDDLGRFRIFGLRPARYTVATSPGSVVRPFESRVEFPGFGTTYFPGTVDPSQIQFVTVRASEMVDGVDFALARTKTFRVRGRAWNAEGEPVTGGIGLLSTERSGANVSIELGARIEPDGEFEFADVVPGDYVLQVVRNRSTTRDEGQFASSFVSVLDRDITDLELRTSTGSSISGRLTFVGGDAPRLDTIEIVALPVDLDRSPRIGGPAAKARVMDDGRFELFGIGGPRRLQVVREPSGWMTKSIIDRGADIMDATLQFGRAEQSLTEVEIVFTNQVTRIVGHLTNRAEAPAGDVNILAFATRRDLWDERTRFFRRVAPGRDGSFTIEGLPPEEYFVVAAAVPDDPGEWQDPDVLDRLSRYAARVRLSEGQAVSVSLQKIATR